MIKLPLISQQCERFKVESGKAGQSWTTWSFEQCFSETQVYAKINRLQAGDFVNVWGYDILNQDWINLVRKPILKRVK